MIALIGPFDAGHIVLIVVAFLSTWLCIFQRAGIIAMLDRMDEDADLGEMSDGWSPQTERQPYAPPSPRWLSSNEPPPPPAQQAPREGRVR